MLCHAISNQPTDGRIQNVFSLIHRECNAVNLDSEIKHNFEADCQLEFDNKLL